MSGKARQMVSDLFSMDPKEVAGSVTTRFPLQNLLRWLTGEDVEGQTPLSRLFDAYAEHHIQGGRRDLRHLLPFAGLDLMNRVTGITKDYAVEKMYKRKFVTRSIIHAIRSVAELGMIKPQEFISPVLVVWNYTQKCNLACSHCYQNAGEKAADELNLAEKLDLVDQIADMQVPLMALSGGEPMTGPHFWKVIEYMGKKPFHTSVATNATLINKRNAARLADCGVDNVRISLDSVDPAKHDAFRGKGCWEATVQGIKNSVAQQGLEVSIASTITRDNLDELEDLIRFCADLGVDYFYTYNFIPVGRGREMVDRDLSPREREHMLDVCYKYFHRIDFGSTAPQMIRRCMELAGPEGKVMSSHLAAQMGGRFGRNFGEIFGGCGCGRVYCTVQPNGIVTPCVYMPIPVGDVRKERLADIWNGSEVFRDLKGRDELGGHCGSCDFKYHCGGCRARAYAYFGDYKGPDPGCKFNQDAWEDLNRDQSLKPAPNVHCNLDFRSEKKVA